MITDSPAQAQTKPAVIVVHPGRQHSQQIVLAAQQAGMLQRFVTSFYWTERGLLTTLVRRLGRNRSLEVRYLRRRWNPEIDSRLVTANPFYHLAARPLTALAATLLPNRGPNVDHLADVLFDRWVAKWLRHQPKPTLVHAFEGGALVTLRRARELGVGTILDVPSAHEWLVHEHNVERAKHKLPGTIRRLKRIAAERDQADLMLVASEYVARCLAEHGVSRSRIAIIPYGVDAERFSPRWTPNATGTFRVLFVGRVAFHKGIQYLLDAWRLAALPDAELIVAGGVSSSVQPVLRRASSNVRFLGQLPASHVYALFKSVDTLVLPSLSDGFGLVILEAMASSVPVIVTSNCGAPVRDGIDGYVTPIRSAHAIAERLEYLHRHPEVRARMGDAARQVVMEKYTWWHYRCRLTAIYEAFARGKPIQAAIDSALEQPEVSARLDSPK